jgi:hypothetical protein
MFKKHNVFTILLTCCVLANSLLAVISGKNIISGLLYFSSLEETLYWLVSLVAICLSFCGGILILRKKRSGIILCLGIYAIQLFGVITSSYNYIIIVGLYIAWSIDLGVLSNIEGSSLEINLVALTIVILSVISLYKISKVSNSEHCT